MPRTMSSEVFVDEHLDLPRRKRKPMPAGLEFAVTRLMLIPIALPALWAIFWARSLTERAVCLLLVAALLVPYFRFGSNGTFDPARTVRYARDEPRLRFVSRRRGDLIGLLSAAIACGLLGGAMLADAWPRAGAAASAGSEAGTALLWAGALILCLGVVLAVCALVRVRVPRGLALDPGGIAARRGGREERWGWGQVAGAAAVRRRGRRAIRIEVGEDRPVVVSAAEMGSSAELVAAIIGFYRERRELRRSLDDPCDAIETFEMKH